MLERGETPRFNTLVPRTVSGEELANISEWCDKYRAQLVADLGAPLGSVQNTLAGQASANHLENVDLQEQMRAELKAQICQLAPAATKRLVVNRHAFVTVDEGVAKYFLEDGGVWACCDAAPVEGRKYCKLVYVEQQKIGEPGVYYCAGQGTHKAGELHNWSTLVRVKTAEACIKPALPKSLHAIGGQKAKVVSEDGDTLRVKAPLFGDKTFSVRRDFVEFLPPDTEMPPPAERPRAKVRKTAEPAPARPAAPHQPVLIYAMRHKCSLEVLRTLLAHGAQPEQVDPQGRNSLSALTAMSVPFTDGELRMMPYGRLFVNAGYRPCVTISRLHVSYAVELLKAGVQPVVEDVGKGNEACAACIREYKDALASVVIRRWMGGDGAMDWLRLVADYIYCK